MPTIRDIVLRGLTTPTSAAPYAAQDPYDRALDEFDTASTPPDALKRTRDYGAPLNALIDLFTPSRADLATAGATKVGALGAKAVAGGAKAAVLGSKALGDLPVAFGTTLYHGSPFTFKKFLSSKIGKGTGDQSEGFGHYLSRAQALAREYAEPLIEWDGWRTKKTPGNVYTVDVPQDVIDNALNYETPLGEQSNILDKLRQLSDVDPSLSGRQLYEQRMLDSAEALLRQKNLPAEKLEQLLTALRGQGRLYFDPDQFPQAVLRQANKNTMHILNRLGITGTRYQYTPDDPENIVIGPAYEKLIQILRRTPYNKK